MTIMDSPLFYIEMEDFISDSCTFDWCIFSWSLKSFAKIFYGLWMMIMVHGVVLPQSRSTAKADKNDLDFRKPVNATSWLSVDCRGKSMFWIHEFSQFMNLDWDIIALICNTVAWSMRVIGWVHIRLISFIGSPTTHSHLSSHQLYTKKEWNSEYHLTWT